MMRRAWGAASWKAAAQAAGLGLQPVRSAPLKLYVRRGLADAAAKAPAEQAAAAAAPAAPAAAPAVAPVATPAAAPTTEGGDKTVASPKVAELSDRILELNVLEINQLLFRLQTRLGISDAQLATSGGGQGPAPAAASAAAAAPVAEAPKDAFDIKLGAVDAKVKIKVIKEIRVITGLGLAESKALVEKAPVVIKTGVKKDEVDKIKKLLLDAGATVEVV